MTQHHAARRAAEEFFAGTERRMDRLPLDLQQRLRKGRVLLADSAAYAESVEAQVLRELARDRRY